MKVLCYFEGDEDDGDEFNSPPDEAARLFCENRRTVGQSAVVVEPVDGEAHALQDWIDDGDGPLFRLFRVTPMTHWIVVEVAAFGEVRW